MPIVSLPAEWHSSTFPTAAPHRTQLFPFRAQFQLFTWPPTTHNRWEMEKWAVVVHSDCSNCNFETQLGRHKATRGRPLLEHKPPIKYKCLRFSEQPPAPFFFPFFSDSYVLAAFNLHMACCVRAGRSVELRDERRFAGHVLFV